MLLLAGFLWLIPAAAFAHAVCFTGSCCSPHAQNHSSTGCDFSNCIAQYTGSNDNGWDYQRNISCGPGSTAANNGGCSSSQYFCGWADAYVCRSSEWCNDTYNVHQVSSTGSCSDNAC
jgi:hypothetical protein